MAGEPWRIVPDGLEIRVRVTPKGGRDAIEGVDLLSDGRAVVKVRVRAAPEDGAANEAVARLLARELGRPASAARLVSGAAARVKTIHVEGNGDTLAGRLAQSTAKEGA